jgi:hypothetical protein
VTRLGLDEAINQDVSLLSSSFAFEITSRSCLSNVSLMSVERFAAEPPRFSAVGSSGGFHGIR